MISEFWVVTSYFNPARYKTKRQNFNAFMAGMSAVGANVLVAELAFGEEPFELEPSSNVLQLRGDAVMWQKERLLNMAAARLPPSCTKIGWFDADVIFKEADWLERTCEALDQYMVVQPFSHAVRLHRNNRDDGTGILDESFASVYVRDPALGRSGPFQSHGHTGYAWAARRELFQNVGLYDAAIAGSADHVMAHAFIAGMIRSPCIPRTFLGSPRYADHFLRWGVEARDLVRARVGVVPGRILHLWHGDLRNRRYWQREREFCGFNFDPERDLEVDENGLWTWSQEASKPLRVWAESLFGSRDEDGELASAAALQ